VSDVRRAVGFSAFAFVPLCCLGVPLLLAGGVSVAGFALVGGVAAAVIAGAAIVVVIVRTGRSRGAAAPTDSESARRS